MERQKSEQHKKRKLFVKALCMVLTLLLMVGIAFSAAILVHETDDLSVSASAGKSAYDLAVQNGYSGDLEQWLMSLAGETGPEGKVGKSAYDLAVEKGYTGTVEEWLGSLIGTPGQTGATGSAGKSAYELAVEHGYIGT